MLRRIGLIVSAVAMLTALVAVTPGSIRADTVAFSSVPDHLPSYLQPNSPGTTVLPPELLVPPQVPATRSSEQLREAYTLAGEAYGVPWEVLAAINRIESNFGENMGPSSAGAIGWMQFLPTTWELWGTDANGDGLADPWNPEDAIYSAARYLAAAGAEHNLYQAIFAYNHAEWYVLDVLDLAAIYSGGAALSSGPPVVDGLGQQIVFEIDMEQRLADARVAISDIRRQLADVEEKLLRIEWRLRAVEERAGNPDLSARDFDMLERRAARLSAKQDNLKALAGELSVSLTEASERYDELRGAASTIGFWRPSPLYHLGEGLEGYIFPVIGPLASFADDFGAHRHSTGWHHGNDIFAPLGTPVVAVTDGTLFSVGWNDVGGNRLWLRDAQGNEFYYAHLAGFSPLALEGATVQAGDVIGYTGDTGDALGTPPHLHFEIHPRELLPLGYDGVVNPYEQLRAWTRIGAEGERADPESDRSLSATGQGAAVEQPKVFTVVEDTVITFTR